MTMEEKLQSFELFANDLDSFYRNRFGYKRPCVFSRYPTIDINRAAVRLYLRFKTGGFWPEDSVVIASISFGKKRQGHGTELLEKLVGLSDRYGFRYIGIEQTGGDQSIQDFVRKFGFENHRNERNWLVPIASLRQRLASLPPRPTRRNKSGPSFSQP